MKESHINSDFTSGDEIKPDQSIDLRAEQVEVAREIQERKAGSGPAQPEKSIS